MTTHSKGFTPIGPDGLSRLRLGQAVAGWHEKGYSDPDEIAALIVEWFDPRWLERELTRGFRRNSFLAKMVDRITAILAREELAA